MFKSLKEVIIIWSFNCLIALDAKCRLCKGSDFIVCFMTCMFKHINATMQVFTRVTGSICCCLCTYHCQSPPTPNQEMGGDL